MEVINPRHVLAASLDSESDQLCRVMKGTLVHDRNLLCNQDP